MLPESSRVKRRFGRKVVPVVEPSGTVEMSVTPAKAGWAAMQAATRYAVVFFAKLIFITISLRN